MKLTVCRMWVKPYSSSRNKPQNVLTHALNLDSKPHNPPFNRALKGLTTHNPPFLLRRVKRCCWNKIQPLVLRTKSVSKRLLYTRNDVLVYKIDGLACIYRRMSVRWKVSSCCTSQKAALHMTLNRLLYTTPYIRILPRTYLCTGNSIFSITILFYFYSFLMTL